MRPIRRVAGRKPPWRLPSKARYSAESKRWWTVVRLAASRKRLGPGRPDPVGCADPGECCPVQLSSPLCLILCLILMWQQNVLGSSVSRFGVPAFGDE